MFQVLALMAALMTLCLATPPPGYVKKPEKDKVSRDHRLHLAVVPVANRRKPLFFSLAHIHNLNTKRSVRKMQHSNCTPNCLKNTVFRRDPMQIGEYV